MAAAFLPVVPTYWEFIRYSTSLDIGEWVVLMKRPKESATGSGLLAPFTWQVWLLVLISVIAVGPIIYFLILLKARLCKDEHNEVYTMPACVWFVYGGLLKQGSTLSPMTGIIVFNFSFKITTIFSRFFKDPLRDVVDFHYYFNGILHSKLNSFFDFITVYVTNKQTGRYWRV